MWQSLKVVVQPDLRLLWLDHDFGVLFVRKGDEIEIEIEKFADRGKSLARLNGYVVFVTGAVPGDRVKARIMRKKKKFAEARLLEVLSPSDLRVEPRCKYFGNCGGCKWQNVDYDAQLAAKHRSVSEALQHQGGYEDIVVKPTIGAENIFHYRNKMEYSFSAARWLTSEEIASGEQFDTSFALGLHAPGQFSRVLDLDTCYLPPPLSINIVNEMRTLAMNSGWAPWDIRKHVGYLRHLVIRTGARTGEVMVNLVTNGFDEERFEIIRDTLKARFPEITTFINTNHTGLAQVAIGEEAYIGFGNGVIHDEIGGFKFEIAPNAFFQTNTVQAEKLYEVVRDFSECTKEDLVYDLYCGAGTISIYMAPHVKRVVGVELVPEAIANAEINTRANGVDNCTFLDGDIKKLFTEDFIASHGKPDLLIVDPPRAGMHAKVVEQIAALRAERFIYVSCNPQTQVRDLQLLNEVYEIEAVQPVDLFPHTHHIENVIKLRVRSGN